MSKYAVTIGSSHAYAMGMNATLNALDYYGVKDIDVYVYSNELMKDYFDYAKDKFSFPLYYVNVDDLCQGYHIDNIAWNDNVFFWGKYPLFLKIKDKYNAILHLDGDCMVADDISENFKIASETGKIVIAQNPHSSMRLSSIHGWADNRDRLFDFCKGGPVVNYVFFMDAKKHVDLLEYVWEYRNKREWNDKNYGLETYYFILGLYDLKKLDQVIELPWKWWIADKYLGTAAIPFITDSNGKHHLLAPDGRNIQVVHGRFYDRAMIKSAIQSNTDPKHNSREKSESFIFSCKSHTKLTDFLNYQWKVKLDVVRNLNASYHTFIPVWEEF